MNFPVYIQFNMLIIKVGGGRDISWDYIAQDLKSLNKEVVIVHGANYWMKQISEKLGIQEKFITSPSGYLSRYTDEETMDLLTMVYSGLVNKKIVSVLQRYGINAVGLTGADGKLLLGVRKESILSKEGEKVKVIHDSKTGNVKSVNTKLIRLLVKNGFVPVVTIPAITDDGELINVDNDRLVAQLVKALKAETVVMLFEAAGLLMDKNNELSKIDKIDKNEIDKFIKSTEGRMRKKLLGVKEAITFGVTEVCFGDGRVKNPISNALFGKGTIIK